MNEIKLSSFGLESVPDVCKRKKWAAKSVQNWIRAGLIPVVVIGTGRSAKFLLRTKDVDAFVTPTLGRPKGKSNMKPRT